MKALLQTLCLSALVLSLLAGCSGSNSTDSPSGDDPSTGNTEPVKFSLALSDTLNPYAQSSPDINADKWVKKLDELANVNLDIQLIPHQEFNQKLQLMFAGSDIPDVLNVLQSLTPLSPTMSGAVKAGSFLPLDDLLQEYGQDLLKVIPQSAWDEVKYDGKIYAIPEYLSIPSRRGTFIRKDLLDQTGLPVPTTVDDYLNMLRAFKKLGLEQPFAFRQEFIYSDVFFGAYDVMPYDTMWEKIGDQILPKFFKTEAMEQALQVYKTMYDEGLMAKEFASNTSAIWTKSISSGQAGMWNHNANQLLSWQNQASQSSPDAEVTLIPSPVGPDGKGGMMYYSSTVRMSYLNSKLSEEKAARIVSFFNYMVSDEARKFFNFGIEGDTYTMQDGKIAYKQPETTEAKSEETFRTTILPLVGDGAINRDMLSLTEDGKKVIELFDTVVAHEGRDGISFNPPLAANSENPDVALKFSNIPPVLLDHMLRMVYGKEEISDWPKVLDEWKAKGGDAIIKEANERYQAKDGVKIGKDAHVES